MKNYNDFNIDVLVYEDINEVCNITKKISKNEGKNFTKLFDFYLKTP